MRIKEQLFVLMHEYDESSSKNELSEISLRNQAESKETC